MIFSHLRAMPHPKVRMSNSDTFICIAIICGFLPLITGHLEDLDISLEGRDSGFFLRFTQPETSSEADIKTVQRIERFTLFQPLNPVTVRAQYGPFSVKQTIIPALMTPASQTQEKNLTILDSLGLPSELPTIFPDLDISAHLVTSEVHRDRPVLRVMFHSSHASDPKLRQHSPDPQKGTLCVALYVHHLNQHLMAVCSPGRDGVCLAEATLPSNWWPPLEAGVWKTAKQQKATVRVEYAVLQSHSMECSNSALPVTISSSINSVFLADVSLSNIHGNYEEVKTDDVVRILVPQTPVYPRSKVYIPVYLQPNPIYPLYVFVIRAKVKSGLRILGAQVSQPSRWKISVDMNARQTSATVTAFVKDTTDTSILSQQPVSIQEIFSWLFEVEEDATNNDSGKIVWQLRYVLDSNMAEQYDLDEDNMRLMSKLDIQKDDVQAVLPIAKSVQLLNTAVLTGRQVSQPMKVFVVSQAGTVGDVTLQSSCHAADESILKASPSCTSVYLDGSEIRGSQNASVLVKYGTYTGQAHFVVWMPELPLVLRLSDTKLSQIKLWRSPQIHRRKNPSSLNVLSTSQGSGDKWEDKEDVICRLRYQQSKVEVYTRFFSVDHNSGREAYLLNRKTELRITKLVGAFLRVADSRIVSLRGNIVQGQQTGRTEVQVLSPITGRVIGAREVRVGTDKETISHLQVSIITAIQLSLSAHEVLSGVFVAKTRASDKLISQYQEGLLDIRMHYSDGTSTSLADINEDDYYLSVDTFNNSVVASAPKSGPHQRIIAIGEGQGDLIHVSLELSEHCHKRRTKALTTTYVYVEVNFSSQATALQNDGRFKNKDFKLGKLSSGSDMIRDGVSFRKKAGVSMLPPVQARQNLKEPVANFSALEIGLYSVIGVFCVAVLLFLASCSVFAIKLKGTKEEPAPVVTQHTNDWVWLGKATLERTSVNPRRSVVPMADFNGNHTPTGGSLGSRVPRREKRNTTKGLRASFPGSEINIHITSNPQQMIEESRNKVDVGTSMDRKVRIHTNPISSSTYTKHSPPPVPPHRDAPPPIPPHRTPPEPSASDMEWENVAQGMDYDQLVHYFDNLKESNA